MLRFVARKKETKNSSRQCMTKKAMDRAEMNKIEPTRKERARMIKQRTISRREKKSTMNDSLYIVFTS